MIVLYFFRINNCVGEDNHYAFIQLIMYATVLCATSLLAVILHYYYFDDCHPHEACHRVCTHSQSRLYPTTRG